MAADLQAIITKVRRLTRSPSANLISDAEIQEYVNTFILYDFPEELRLFEYRTTLTWYCLPFIAEYPTDTTGFVTELLDFDNRYITTHYPMYSAGSKMMFTQKREEFFNVWPQTNNIVRVATGDGILTDFTGTLTAIPVLPNNVTFSAITTAGTGLELHDDGAGNLIGDTGGGPNTINYLNGDFQLSFVLPPNNFDDINAMTFPYKPSRPTSLLYYDNKFTLRPVPDQPYPINMEVYIRPDELIQLNQLPKLEQYWQYIAIGASIKIFQDRSDNDSAALLMPEFKHQEMLVQRRSWVQYSNEQVGTIYTGQLSDRNQFGSGNNNFYW